VYSLGMTARLDRPMVRLRMTWIAILASLVVCGFVVLAAFPSPVTVNTQTPLLAWILGVLAAVNLATVAPVRRAMVEGGRRRAAVAQRSEPLVAAYQAASVLAWARVELVAALGLVVLLTTGRSDLFWVFLGVAAAAMVALWPGDGPIEP
jgi:hypothetical protein